MLGVVVATSISILAAFAINTSRYTRAQVDREIAAERKRELALGLDFRRPGSPAQGPGEGEAKEADQDSAKDDGADDDAQERGDEKPDASEGA